MSAAFEDKWFMLALAVIAFACIFLLAAADTAGVVPFDSFKAIAEWLWKFFVGGAAGAGLLKFYQAQALKREGGDPPANGGT